VNTIPSHPCDDPPARLKIPPIWAIAARSLSYQLDGKQFSTSFEDLPSTTD
jgi:hypothetical protein